jgi:hypothetical protein
MAGMLGLLAVTPASPYARILPALALLWLLVIVMTVAGTADAHGRISVTRAG